MKALWNRFANTARAQDACAASCCAASHFILGIISDAGFLSGSAVALKIFFRSPEDGASLPLSAGAVTQPAPDRRSSRLRQSGGVSFLIKKYARSPQNGNKKGG